MLNNLSLKFKHCEERIINNVKFYCADHDIVFAGYLLKMIKITKEMKDNEGNPIFKETWNIVGDASEYMPKKFAKIMQDNKYPAIAIFNNIPTIFQIAEDKVYVYDLVNAAARIDAINSILDVCFTEMNK